MKEQGWRLEMSDGAVEVSLPEHVFMSVLSSALGTIDVSEEWYLSLYPDVREALVRGDVRSAKDHFVNFGYFEGRLPFEIEVDDEFYMRSYDDVAEAIRNGKIESCKSHFVAHGALEGRDPYPGFTFFSDCRRIFE